MNISKTIGENIQKCRKSREMTREQLAEALNLDTAYLGQCERGERQLGLTKTIAVMEYFGVTANDLIPINLQLHTQNRTLYMERIYDLLENCSDNQLLAVTRVIKSLLPFLRD